MAALHELDLDGVISGDIQRGVRFHEATDLGSRHAEALAHTAQRRVLRWFARRGLLERTTAADMRTRRGTGGTVLYWLHGSGSGIQGPEVGGLVEPDSPPDVAGDHAVEGQHVSVVVGIERAPEALREGDGPELRVANRGWSTRTPVPERVP